MKKIVVFTLLIILIPTLTISGVRVWGIRADGWKILSKTNKTMYIQGIFEGLLFSEFIIEGTKLSSKITVDQYVNALDILYSDYKNSLIPVSLLLRIIALEIQGADKATVEKEIEIYRKYFSKVGL